MRRPLSLYAPGEGTMSAGYSEGLQRSGSYRILKSTPSYPIAPRNLEHASARDANIYGMPGPGPRMIQTQEPLCAFLTMDMHVVKATTTFSETIATPMIIGRKLLDIVSGSDREKVARLQRILEEERRQRDPTYLPPIYARMDEQTHIQSVPFALDEMGMGRSDHQEMFIFSGAEGQHRAIPARLTLAKKESTYFIVMFLALPQTPQTPQAFQQPSLSPYTRESYSRESQSQYGFQPGPQPYVQSQGPPFVANPGYANSRPESMSYRAPAPPGQNAPFPASMPPFAATPARSEYHPHQNPFETTPRSELGQSQPQRQHDLQLPPIRDQRGEQSSMGSAPRRDDRSSRVDIGGLLEKPHGPGR
ncbi:hypothetical protein B0J14DRAFT_476513 [Halenospora varia]|nr:hypothetical protein B0J14DRAFT_476513 [Halenospora varia]